MAAFSRRKQQLSCCSGKIGVPRYNHGAA